MRTYSSADKMPKLFKKVSVLDANLEYYERTIGLKLWLTLLFTKRVIYYQIFF